MLPPLKFSKTPCLLRFLPLSPPPKEKKKPTINTNQMHTHKQLIETVRCPLIMASLPPGFQFFPSDEELVVHFLYRKALGQRDVIPSLDLYNYDPWELDGKALQGGNYWYFFCRRTQNRATASGYWDAEGDEEPVTSGSNDVGTKKTFAFYAGEAPGGIKTSWVMHEYHILQGVDSSSSSSSSSRRSSKKRGHPRMDTDKWVICRVYNSSCNSPVRSYGDGMELSCLDEAFLSLEDDLDEISWPH